MAYIKNKGFFLVLFGILNFTGIYSQASFNVMFYNILNFPSENAVPNRIAHLEVILDDYRPDIFMVCELNNEFGANSILQMIQERINNDFEMATFQTNTSDDTIGNQNDLQNLIYYDGSKFTLESQTIVPTIYRDFNHYRLKLNTVNQDTNPLYLDAIVCHLKASNGTQNQASRLQMVNDLTTYLGGLPTNSNVLLAGDFNVYTSSEPAFLELIDTTNPITFVDPANSMGSWHNNTNYVNVFTQSTRTQTGFGGSNGGFDDRFDFIMTSENMITNSDLYYSPNSYQVYGNNGNVPCYNKSIIDSECAGAKFSVSIREALYYFSDHLPVTLKISTNATLSIPEFITSISKPIEIVGPNYIQNTLTLKVNTLPQGTNYLKIYNTLGQHVKTIPVKTAYTYNVTLTNLSAGIYYIVANNTQVEPLKFIKTH
ncbi:endonuclease/exonuclease/phosphatase family protein [Bizionia hallyeonensis]|uniref:Endonuclease/exonuclease/phosphatase family protein n=1 Tax=Bizionia hallyeonensis TaxID=1123757 RepID=A0ABW0C9I0_9FLAO